MIPNLSMNMEFLSSSPASVWSRTKQKKYKPNQLTEEFLCKGFQPGFIYFSSHVSSHLTAENVPNSAAAVTMVNTFVQDSFCSSVSYAQHTHLCNLIHFCGWSNVTKKGSNRGPSFICLIKNACLFICIFGVSHQTLICPCPHSDIYFCQPDYDRQRSLNNLVIIFKATYSCRHHRMNDKRHLTLLTFHLQTHQLLD